MQVKDLSISAISGVRHLTKLAVGTTTRSPIVPTLYTGVEIEAEDVAMPDNATNILAATGWTWHVDHSLRDDGMEFVLGQPSCGDELAAAIDGLQDAVDAGLGMGQSPRAGTHVHVNMSDRTMGHVQAAVALMYAFDSMFFAYAGVDRQWCSYCNSLNTLPANLLRSLLRNPTEEAPGYISWRDMWNTYDGDRYYGLNITSIGKYGTLEFRYFPTAPDTETLWSWIDLCHAVWKLAEEFSHAPNPPQAALDWIKLDVVNAVAKLQQYAGGSEKFEGMIFEGWQDVVRDAAEELEQVIATRPASYSELAGEGVDIAETFRPEPGVYDVAFVGEYGDPAPPAPSRLRVGTDTSNLWRQVNDFAALVPAARRGQTVTTTASSRRAVPSVWQLPPADAEPSAWTAFVESTNEQENF